MMDWLVRVPTEISFVGIVSIIRKNNMRNLVILVMEVKLMVNATVTRTGRKELTMCHSGECPYEHEVTGECELPVYDWITGDKFEEYPFDA